MEKKILEFHMIGYVENYLLNRGILSFRKLRRKAVTMNFFFENYMDHLF